MIVYNERVIKEAFLQILGRLAPAELQECIDEFSATYAVTGTGEAFKNALTAKAPMIDPATFDNLFTRFEGALKLAQVEQKEEERQERERQEQRRKDAKTDDEKREAREEAERLTRQVSHKTAEFRLVNDELRRVNRDILTEAMSIRQLARDSGYSKAEPVILALQALDEITGRDGEVERLVKDSGDIANRIPDASRSGDTATIDGTTMVAESFRDRLRDILVVEMPAARNAVQAAITVAENAKTTADTQEAIRVIVEKAKADIDAIDGSDGIAMKVDAAVAQYKIDVIGRTGKPPTSDVASPNNPDNLVKAANDALRDARTENDAVVREAATANQASTKVAGERVAAERVKAQAALDTITRWSTALQRAKAAEVAQEGYTSTVDEKEKKEKEKKVGLVDKLFSKWWARAVLMAVLFLFAFVVIPNPYKAFLCMAAIPVAIAAIFFWKARPSRWAFGSYAVVVALLIGTILMVPVLHHAPQGKSGLPGENLPAVTATSSAKSVGERPSQEQLNAERTATAEAAKP